MVGLILYFLIGYVLGLAYYAYECRRFKQKGYWHWESYNDDKEGVTFVFFLCVFIWPLLLICLLLYLIVVYPTEYIRKYYGIK